MNSVEDPDFKPAAFTRKNAKSLNRAFEAATQNSRKVSETMGETKKKEKTEKNRETGDPKF